MKKIYLLFLPILFLSCKQNVIETGVIEKQIKTPREMTWTADTLTSPDATSFQLMMRNILAFSSTDIWVCGWSDVARGLIWHYDGKKWSESNIRDDVGGMRVDDLAGYSSKDLWACGYSGDNIFLAHYNGQHWTRENDMGIKGELLDMYKDSNGNLWACGRYGVVMKYDKIKWIAETINIKHETNTEYFLNSIQCYSGKTYVISRMLNQSGDKYHFICGDINKWSILDSMIINSPSSKLKWGQWSLISNDDKKLYSVGQQGIWSYNNESWVQIYKNSSTLYGFASFADNYLIAVGDFQEILFSNGIAWENISSLFSQIDRNNFVCRNVWTDGYETFIIGYGNIGGSTGSIVFHGK